LAPIHWSEISGEALQEFVTYFLKVLGDAGSNGVIVFLTKHAMNPCGWCKEDKLTIVLKHRAILCLADFSKCPHYPDRMSFLVKGCTDYI